MKKAVSILALLAFLITTALTVSATTIHAGTAGNTNSDLVLFAEFDALAEAQRHATEAYDILYKSFIDEVDNTLVYPENYGGAHIEDNILHIHIVDVDNQDLSFYQTLLETHSEHIVFVDADYPLQALIDSGMHASSELRKQGISVVGCRISEKDNRVTVEIQEEDTEDATRAAVDHARKQYETVQTRTSYGVPVNFDHGAIPSVCYDIMGGTQLTSLTIGACGTYQGQPAFALCGHGLEQNDVVYLATDEADYLARAGTIQVHQFEDYGYGDYSIALNSANISPSAYAGNPNGNQYAIRASVDQPAQGTRVLKYGSRGSFARGVTDEWYIDEATEIRGMDPEWPWGTVHIRGLVEVQMESGRVTRGDSGGPVLTNNDTFCGVVSCAHYNNNNGTTDTYADDYATEVFYFSPYTFLRTAGFTVSTTQ